MKNVLHPELALSGSVLAQGVVVGTVTFASKPDLIANSALVCSIRFVPVCVCQVVPLPVHPDTTDQPDSQPDSFAHSLLPHLRVLCFIPRNWEDLSSYLASIPGLGPGPPASIELGGGVCGLYGGLADLVLVCSDHGHGLFVATSAALCHSDCAGLGGSGVLDRVTRSHIGASLIQAPSCTLGVCPCRSLNIDMDLGKLKKKKKNMD